MMTETELLFEAIRDRNAEKLQNLLNANPQLVASKDARGFTPLIFATYFDNEAAAENLIDHNADVNGTDASGNTALIGVSFKGNIDLVNLLIQNGADINAQNNNGTTALSFATQYNQDSAWKADPISDKSSKIHFIYGVFSF
ncbi:MAG: ankyrin repeat domain-containing protein [Bacteroidota bacterium]